VETWVQITLTSFTAVGASSGFWAYVMRRSSSKSAMTRLMMGLAYEKLMEKGEKYLDRGWVARDEYEDYRKYFFEPYKELGGNGVAERIMNGVSELPIVGQSRHEQMFHVRHNNQEFVNNVRVVGSSQREASPERP
jgi:hypothetical protein